MPYDKTTWNPGGPPGISAENLNKIESGVEAAHKLVETDIHTPDQSQTAQASGALLKLQNYWANMLRRILGTTNWHDAPPTTLTAAKSHIDAAAPHSGHETPTGAQTKVDAHADLTAAHSATSAATANRIMMRDSAGRAKVAAPAVADDIARKDTVDAKFDPSTGHKHTGATGQGPKIDPATGLTWVPARIASGSYTGDGTKDRFIAVGFTPVRVQLIYLDRTYATAVEWGITDSGAVCHAGNSTTKYSTIKCVENGFVVGFDNPNDNQSGNKDTQPHYWVAWQ